MNINIPFCRSLMKATHADVKRILPEVNPMKDAWTYTYGRDQWEFQVTIEQHGLHAFMWYGSASNAYDARHQGWNAYLRHFHPSFVEILENEAKENLEKAEARSPSVK